MKIGGASSGIVALICLSLVVCGCGQTSGPGSKTTAAKTKAPPVAKAETNADAAPRTSDRTARENPPAATELSTANGAVPPAEAANSAATPAVQPAGGTIETAGGAGTAEGVQLATAISPIDEAPTADLTMPRVSLTKAHAETCRVRVGDTLPELTLVNLDGKEQSLAKLLGKKLTVVLFWNGSKPTALEELRDLGPDVLSRFSGNGVAVVAVNTGDESQAAAELVKQSGVQFPQLSDPQGEAFKLVAATKVPRTYLVDPTGKILWFDLEYSRTTRRELVQAIRYLLSHK